MLFERVRDRAQKISGIAFFVAVNRSLQLAGFSTPVAGMLLIFGVMLLLQALLGDGVARSTFDALEPGYRFLTKWSALFFVPALVNLPLVQERFSGPVLLRLLALLLVGWLGTLVSTAAVAGVFPEATADDPEAPAKAASPQRRPYPRPGAPYKRRWLPAYLVCMVLGPLGAGVGLWPVAGQSLYMLCASLLAFAGANNAPAGVKAYLHPLFACVGGSWLAAWLWAVCAGPAVGFLDVLARYRAWPGAGALLSFMLGPAVVALGLLLYERRKLLGRELVPMIGTCLAASFMSLFGTAFLARALALPKALAVSSLPRCVTAAIAIDMASTLGAVPTYVGLMVVLTGFVGAAFGQAVFRALNLTSARTRGLAMGASAHGLGTAQLSSTDQEAFPYSAVGFALVAACSAAMVQVPLFRNLLFRVLAM